MYYRLSFLLIFFLSSCLNNSNVDDTSKSDSTKALHQVNVVEKKSIDTGEVSTLRSNNIKIDSNKLIKGFDNIYFGVPENASSDFFNQYSIGYNIFELKDLSYDKEYGLYGFYLKSTQEFVMKDFNGFKNDISKIINVKYGSPQKINIIKSNSIGELAIKIENENKIESEPKIPLDCYQSIRILKWTRNSIDIYLAYEIDYKPKFYKTKGISANRDGFETMDTDKVESYEKYLKPFLYFEYKPYKKNLIKYEINEAKKEVDKF
jgi:hypothetical protein